MGQVSVLESVFGGETIKLELETLLVIYEDYDYYFCCELTRDIFGIIEYPWDGFTSGIFSMIIYFKALYVVSPKRPTVVFLLKPFMWCRSDARLWHFF